MSEEEKFVTREEFFTMRGHLKRLMKITAALTDAVGELSRHHRKTMDAAEGFSRTKKEKDV